ncbi:MAG: hypothetical protein DRI36_04475 [Caldiserica bacterium]|nr:MAG: hypothetical protein DRI36_04475 [Caldisericota bacterium]
MEKRRILIVDDEKETRDLLKFYFEKEGFEVLEAINGKDAEEKIKSDNIDLIVMDIVMPEENGIELLKSLRFERIPIIVISGKKGFKEILLEEEEYNIIDFFEKPFKVKELVERVKEIL